MTNICREMGKRAILRSAVAHFRSRGSEWHPGYSTASQRADNIERCAGMANGSSASRSHVANDDPRDAREEGTSSTVFHDRHVTTASGADPLIKIINSQDTVSFTDVVGENHLQLFAKSLSDCTLILGESLESVGSDNFSYRRTAEVSVPLKHLDVTDDGVRVANGSNYFAFDGLKGWWVNMSTKNGDELISRKVQTSSSAGHLEPKHEIKHVTTPSYSLFFTNKDTAANVANLLRERSKECQR